MNIFIIHKKIQEYVAQNGGDGNAIMNILDSIYQERRYEFDTYCKGWHAGRQDYARHQKFAQAMVDGEPDHFSRYELQDFARSFLKLYEELPLVSAEVHARREKSPC